MTGFSIIDYYSQCISVSVHARSGKNVSVHGTIIFPMGLKIVISDF